MMKRLIILSVRMAGTALGGGPENYCNKPDARALVPKHFHFLLRTGRVPISTVMWRSPFR